MSDIAQLFFISTLYGISLMAAWSKLVRLERRVEELETASDADEPV
jgi:hypothetical protein